MEIPDLSPGVHLHALKSGLRPGKFQEAIAVNKSMTLAEFREKAQGQMEIEELRQARQTDKTDFNKKPNKPNNNIQYQQRGNHQGDLELKVNQSTKQSRNLQGSKKHGHNTKDCVIVNELLERLARHGHLDKYIDGHIHKNPAGNSSNNNSKGKQAVDGTPKTRGTINYISGGFAGGGDTNLARKRSYRAMLAVGRADLSSRGELDVPEITFKPSDFQASTKNIDDPVVIYMYIRKLIVRKALLDLGSRADVLFYSTFKKMKISDKVLQPSTGELVGFSKNDNTIAIVYADHKEAQQCYNASFRKPPPEDKVQNINSVYNVGELPPVAELDPRTNTNDRPNPTEEVEKLIFADNSEKFTYIGSTLPKTEKAELIKLLTFVIN
ncbi:hypothetical protein PIB30_044476 [Stylosanthes scabra]|uniref:Uncharacterized protein n=1 Tax=Stylosanthes scabra TaxID=79078 RepID=A0ABU6VGL0_9FABA|nr:hypothetical protein [Stylosanthes scabra]